MRQPERKRDRLRREWRTVLAALIAANVIAAAGFIYEYGVISILIGWFGVVGCMILIAALMWALLIIIERVWYPRS
jgi:fatty acid desaturase